MSDLNTLYQQHSRRIAAFVCNRVPRDWREDIQSEVWLKIARNFERFDGRNFIGWSCKIAKNAIIDFHKKQAIRPTVVNFLDGLTNTTDNTIANVLHAERWRLLRHCVGRLQDIQRTVVEQRMRGESNQTVAALLEITPGYASNLWAAAKEKLRHCVKTTGENL